MYVIELVEGKDKPKEPPKSLKRTQQDSQLVTTAEKAALAHWENGCVGQRLLCSLGID